MPLFKSQKILSQLLKYEKIFGVVLFHDNAIDDKDLQIYSTSN